MNVPANMPESVLFEMRHCLHSRVVCSKRMQPVYECGRKHTECVLYVAATCESHHLFPETKDT